MIYICKAYIQNYTYVVRCVYTKGPQCCILVEFLCIYCFKVGIMNYSATGIISF